MPTIRQEGGVKTVAGLPERWGKRAHRELAAALERQRLADLAYREACKGDNDKRTIQALNAWDDANQGYADLCGLLDSITGGPVPVDTTDAQLCIMAAQFASDCATVPVAEAAEYWPMDGGVPADGMGPRQYGRAAPGLSPRARMAQICQVRGIEQPDIEDDAEAMARMVDAKWWRKQLRRTHGRALEHAAMRLGFVSNRAGSYCSNETVTRRGQQVARNAAAMRGTMLRNQATGQEFSLYDLAQKGVANKQIRKGELMLRMAGCEDVATEYGHVGLFVTLTAPSKYHPVIAGSGTVNPKYCGATPRETQGYLNQVWARTRAQNARDDVAAYGFRIVEPHHDGCPHWHMLVFMSRADAYGVEGVGPGEDGGALWLKRGFVANLADYALAEDGDEPGAKRNRLKVVEIDPAKGGAAAYIMKYIGKNIDDSQGEARDEEGAADLGGELMTPCQRVDAWAAVWGIRQFQGIGMPPVTVWRELRRIKGDHDQAPDYIRQALSASRRIEKADPETGEIELVKAADFAEYIRAQGGVNLGRNSRIVIAWRGGYVPGRYGVTVRDVPAGVVEAVYVGTLYPSLRYEWADAGRVSGVPRSPFNNCTDQAEPGLTGADFGPVEPVWWVQNPEMLAEYDDSAWWEGLEFAAAYIPEHEQGEMLDRAVVEALEMWARSDEIHASRQVARAQH